MVFCQFRHQGSGAFVGLDRGAGAVEHDHTIPPGRAQPVETEIKQTVAKFEIPLRQPVLDPPSCGDGQRQGVTAVTFVQTGQVEGTDNRPAGGFADHTRGTGPALNARAIMLG